MSHDTGIRFERRLSAIGALCFPAIVNSPAAPKFHNFSASTPLQTQKSYIHMDINISMPSFISASRPSSSLDHPALRCSARASRMEDTTSQLLDAQSCSRIRISVMTSFPLFVFLPWLGYVVSRL